VGVGGEDGQVLGDGLRDEHAVEGVTVVEGEGGGGEYVVFLDRQDDEFEILNQAIQERLWRFGYRQAARMVFGGNLPDACQTEQIYSLGIIHYLFCTG